MDLRADLGLHREQPVVPLLLHGDGNVILESSPGDRARALGVLEDEVVLERDPAEETNGVLEVLLGLGGEPTITSPAIDVGNPSLCSIDELQVLPELWPRFEVQDPVRSRLRGMRVGADPLAAGDDVECLIREILG